MACITNEFDDLEGAVKRHEAVFLRWCLHEAARLCLHDAEPVSMTCESCSTRFDNGVSQLLADRLAAVTRFNENDAGLR